MDPVVVTSLTPKITRLTSSGKNVGHAYQLRCVESWQKAGALVVSVNSDDEISTLRSMYSDVLFWPSYSAGLITPGRPLVSIAEILEVGVSLARDNPFCVANSDIEFSGTETFLTEIINFSRNGFSYGSRSERSWEQAGLGMPYLYGFDFFCFSPLAATAMDMSCFAMGAPWWDYLLLFSLTAKGIPGHYVTAPLFVHLTHDQNWNYEYWSRNFGLTVSAIRSLKGGDDSPLAYLADYLLSSFDDRLLPMYSARDSRGYVGTMLGLAMVKFIRDGATSHLSLAASGRQLKKLTPNAMSYSASAFLAQE